MGPSGGGPGGRGGFEGGMGPGGGPGGPRGGPGGGGSGLGTARQALTVTLTNPTQAPVEVQITEVNSALGNFVPIPEKATLAPAESVTLEPMRGALANLDEFTVKLGLRVDRQTEQQSVMLKRLPDTPPAN